MTKPLAEMTLEELWRLFPIILKEHNSHYSEWYREEEEHVVQALGEAVKRISHMGSTAIPGLIAKPTVDILVEVGEDCDWNQVEERLLEAGWTCMSRQEEPAKKMSYNKGYTPLGFAEKVYHLHVRSISDVGELYFRDYLLAHPEVAKDYGRLKESLFREFEHNRDGYTEAKTEFIRAITEKARAAYPDRYRP